MGAHFVVGIGTDVRHDQGYFSCAVYETLRDALQELTDTFELGKERRARLRRHLFLRLRGPVDGAAYCEITRCTCADRRVHEDG